MSDDPDAKAPARAAWARVEQELARTGKNPSWLAERLEFKQVQRVYNWKYRGLPTDAYQMVADALGKSLSWVAGAQEKSPSEQDSGMPSPMAMQLAVEFDRLHDSKSRLEVFAHCVGVIARASAVPATATEGMPASRSGIRRRPQGDA